VRETRRSREELTKTPSLQARHPKSPLITSIPPSWVFAIPNNPKLLSKAIMACPAACAVGRYFPLPAPESNPSEKGGREFRKVVMRGQGYHQLFLVSLVHFLHFFSTTSYFPLYTSRLLRINGREQDRK